MAETRRPLQRAACQPHPDRASGAQGRDVLHRWLMATRKLSHLNAANRPTMVDVAAKEVTLRSALAEARVRLPPAITRALRASGHRTKKGPVFDTAVIAG